MTSSPLLLPAGIAPEMLRTVFQPIFRLATAEVLGYEALLRGPVGSAMETPAALFAAARDTAGAIALETAPHAWPSPASRPCGCRASCS